MTLRRQLQDDAIAVVGAGVIGCAVTQLLFGFWRELFARDGALDIPLRRVMSLSPWLARFAIAACRKPRFEIAALDLQRFGA